MEILFEITRIGSVVRVVAVDPDTGEEAVIQGPAQTSLELLKKTASDKLLYILEKKKGRPR